MFNISAFCWSVSAISWYIVSTGILLEERPIFKSCFKVFQNILGSQFSEGSVETLCVCVGWGGGGG